MFIYLNLIQGDDMILKSRVLRNLERKQAMTEKLEAAMHDDDNNLVVCLDLSWSQSMSAKVRVHWWTYVWWFTGLSGFAFFFTYTVHVCA